MGSLWDRLIFGHQSSHPLLFADLAILGILGLWAQYRALARRQEVSEPLREF